MAFKLIKKFPENYSKDIVSVINDLTLKSGSPPFLQGSGKLKLNYPSDYDLAQYVPVNSHIKADFKNVIKKLLKNKNVYIGDIKSGEIPELKVVPNDTNASNYNERRESMISKLKDFYKNGFIDKVELNESLKLLKPNLTNIDITIVKHDIRYEVIRWKPQDILNGFVIYRKHKVDFTKYLYGDNTTKIDVVTWVNGIRYSECTMIYFFMKNGKPTNTMATKFEEAIKNEMPYLLYKKKYMKICKRMNNLETISKKPDEKLLKEFFDLFNSDLSLLNQVISDIGVLKYLIENVKNISKEKFEYEIDQMKYRLGNMTNSQYLNKEKSINILINELEKDVVDIALIDKLENSLQEILNNETLKIMKQWGIYPIPNKYLPTIFHSNVDVEKSNDKTNYTNLLFSGKGKKICMEKTDIIKEHKKLIPILRKGNIKQRMNEAMDQENELKNYL
jgi:hypothetical protein